MSNLTAKQEQFILKVVEGMSKTDAYKEVYDTSRMKAKTINNKASTLFNKKEVKERYQELMKNIQEESKWTIEKAVDDLIWLKDEAQKTIENEGLRQASSNAFLSAVKELNTLLDLYPKKNVDEDNKEDKLDKIFGSLEAVFKQ